MPKKPRQEKEPYEWKCKVCKMTGRAATKDDADLALALHFSWNHGKRP
jgi:hypothetical protein